MCIRDSHIAVSLSLDEDVFASVGKIIFKLFPTFVKNSLVLPLKFNFIIGAISFTETPLLLRAEKGFIIVGQDTDGTMTPIDLQMDWIVSKKKYDFIGKRSLYRSDTMREDRKQLVGLLTDDPKVVLEEGAQIVSELNKSPVEMLGHVTSSYFSPNLNKSIALAVVRGGKDMMGKKLFIPMEDKTINVTVSNPVFFDQTNERLNA